MPSLNHSSRRSRPSSSTAAVGQRWTSCIRHCSSTLRCSTTESGFILRWTTGRRATWKRSSKRRADRPDPVNGSEGALTHSSIACAFSRDSSRKKEETLIAPCSAARLAGEGLWFAIQLSDPHGTASTDFHRAYVSEAHRTYGPT